MATDPGSAVLTQDFLFAAMLHLALLLCPAAIRAAEPVSGDGSGVRRYGWVHSLGPEVHSVVFLWRGKKMLKNDQKTIKIRISKCFDCLEFV